MRDYIIGAIGTLTVILVSAWVGYKLGKHDSVVNIQQNPLVTAACVKSSTFKPMDDSFGATTISITKLAGQYKILYRAACTANIVP